MKANVPKPAGKAARSSNLVVDDLRTELLAACNGSHLPVTVVHLILTDLCNAYAQAERDQLARERAAEARPPEAPGKGTADAGTD